MANGYLYRSGANSSASGTTATVSMWVRKHDESPGDGGLFQFFTDGSNFCSAYANPVLKFRNFIAGGYSTGDITCNRKLKDCGAWYHLQFVWDTSNSTAADRMRIYVNGVRETSFSGSTNPSSSYSFSPVVSGTFYLNRYNANSTTGSQSYSHVHYCDGYAYEPTVFGSTDTGTGEWKINASPTCNYGSNGFFILKDGSSTTDQSGNSKTFTTSGTLTNTEDCPSNVFNTINVLNPQVAGMTIANGNLSLTAQSDNNWRTTYGTLAASSGKFYWEQKVTAASGSSHQIGITDQDENRSANSNDFENANVSAYGYRGDGGKLTSVSGSTVLTASAGDSFTNGDIIGVAMDLDNQKLYFSKNGTWQASGDPTSGSTGTGSFFNITAGKFYTPASPQYNSSSSFQYNFGNGFFGTTAISSEGTNASNIGKFEYDVPTGYTALSTKGLNE